jgi:hypothetical protein
LIDVGGGTGEGGHRWRIEWRTLKEIETEAVEDVEWY